MADCEVWLVSAVSYKGERFTHGYAFFSEASALCHIEREKREDAERVKHGRQCIHAPESWQTVRYVPESAKAEAQPAGTDADLIADALTLAQGVVHPGTVGAIDLVEAASRIREKHGKFRPLGFAYPDEAARPPGRSPPPAQEPSE